MATKNYDSPKAKAKMRAKARVDNANAERYVFGSGVRLTGFRELPSQAKMKSLSSKTITRLTSKGTWAEMSPREQVSVNKEIRRRNVEASKMRGHREP